MLAGAIIGAAIGLVIAVNVVIFSGVDNGYEATPVEVLEQRPVAAMVSVVAFVTSTGVGMMIGRRS